MSRQPCTTAWYSTPRALWKRLAISSSVIVSIRSTRSGVASPRKDWIPCTSHWNNSVVSGVSGRSQPAPRSRTAPIRWSFLQTPTRCRVGLGGRVVRSVSQRIEPTVTLATSFVKRYTAQNPGEGGPTDGTGTDDPTRADPRARPVLPAPRPPRVWRPNRARRADGARDGRRKEVAHQGRDAGRDRRLPIPARPPCDPGRHLDLVHPWRLLGSVGWRVGIHPAELHHRGNTRRALRPPRRASLGDSDLLWREPRSHRTDPALMLPADKARDEGLVGVGARRSGLRYHRRGTGRSRARLHRVRGCRRPVLRLTLPRAQDRIDDHVAHARRAARRLRRLAGDSGRDTGQAPHVLPEGWLAHFRQWPRHRTVPRERPRPTDGLAQRARVPRRGGHGDDQSRPCRHHRNLRGLSGRGAAGRLPRRRVLGLTGVDDRHLPAVLSARLDRRADPRPLPDEPERAGVHQGCLRRGHRHDPGRLRAPWPDRHR